MKNPSHQGTSSYHLCESYVEMCQYVITNCGKDEDKTKDAHPSTSLEVNIGNTHLIDIEYDELDKVVERGRD